MSDFLKENTNENCLAGVRCPGCGQFSRFHITGMTTTEMCDNGSDGMHDFEYEDDANCVCFDCGYDGQLSEFHLADKVIQRVLETCELPPEVDDYWEDDPDYPPEDWKHEVGDENTREGYWEWVRSQREMHGHEEADDAS